MIQIERLPKEEFEALKTVADGFCPDADKSVAVVARNDGRIIGRCFLLAPAHVEGIYIERAWRGGSLFKDMMAAMEIEARAEGITKLFAYAVEPSIGEYIDRRCGYLQLPWKVFSKELLCR